MAIKASELFDDAKSALRRRRAHMYCVKDDLIMERFAKEWPLVWKEWLSGVV